MKAEELKFIDLQVATKARLPHFRDSNGRLCHSRPDGSDWSPAQWLQAVIGELGEYANERKKFERGDLTFEEYKRKAEAELADVAIYFSILAQRALDVSGSPHPDGVDLPAAIISKFNKVSDRIGCNIYP